MSISNIIEIGRRSLFAQQSAINTTGRNIANVNTVGYSRQRLNLRQDLIGVSYLGSFGQEATTQIRQSFTDMQIWRENSNLGQFSTDASSLAQIQDVFAEPTDAGIANLMSEFWNSWNDLSNDPDSETAKIVVRDKAIQLSNGFNRVHDELLNHHNQIHLEMEDKVVQINDAIEQIASLNQQILNTDDHSLKDTRALMVDELSQMVDISVAETANGELNIAIGGMVVVSGQEVNKIKAQSTNTDGIWNTQIELEDTQQKINISGGELASLLKLQNETIPNTINELNTFAKSFADKVNEVHKNNTNGISFFDTNVTGAGDIAVNSDFMNNPDLVGQVEEGGDSSFALEMFNLQNENVIDGKTFGEFYTGIITTIGSKVSEANYLTEAQSMVLNKLEIDRMSVSGVSLDEEMTHMIQYEQAYNAAAKLVSTVDEMLSSILNIV